MQSYVKPIGAERELNRQSVIFHEQQALHRLKRLLLEAPPPLTRRWRPWKFLQAVLIAVFRRPGLVREVAPGQFTQAEPEWRSEQLLRQL